MWVVQRREEGCCFEQRRARTTSKSSQFGTRLGTQNQKCIKVSKKMSARQFATSLNAPIVFTAKITNKVFKSQVHPSRPRRMSQRGFQKSKCTHDRAHGKIPTSLIKISWGQTPKCSHRAHGKNPNKVFKILRANVVLTANTKTYVFKRVSASIVLADNMKNSNEDQTSKGKWKRHRAIEQWRVAFFIQCGNIGPQKFAPLTTQQKTEICSPVMT